MTNSFEASALAHRIAILDEIGVGPLWLRRDALIDSIPSADAAAPIAASISAPAPSSTSSRPQPSSPPQRTRTAPVANAPAGDAAWDDDAPAAAGAAAAPIKTSLTLCTRTGAGAADGAAALRYLFIARSSSVQGAEELFDNILLALGLRKEAQTAGDLADLSTQVAAHKPSVLIVMEPAAALQLVAGDDGNGGDGDNQDSAFDALRGHMHRVGGLPVLVTYGAVHLLRNPADKRKAWDDLCLLTTLQAADVVDPA
ncbi:MAG TPA: hypothetical protein VGM52_16385 [Herbaspirillum sp.]|jgi:DNA polymerase